MCIRDRKDRNILRHLSLLTCRTPVVALLAGRDMLLASGEREYPEPTDDSRDILPSGDRPAHSQQ